MANARSVAELQRIVGQLGQNTERLCELLAAQRQAVGVGNLNALLQLTAEYEEAAARLARLEQRRQVLQDRLEAITGVRGLREIARAVTLTEADRARFLEAVEDLQRGVVRLHAENARASALLHDAIDVARRTRAYLARLAGAEPAYGQTAPPGSGGIG